jgi:uncharacterized protein
MNRSDALKILEEHVKGENLRRHMLAAEAVMRALARKFGAEHNTALGIDEDKWGLAGLLHDVDWEETKDNPAKHTELSRTYLTAAGLDSEIVKAIYVHNDLHNEPRETLMEKTLYVSEELTGLITACALVRPDKKISLVKLKSVLKRFKTPAFAAGVHREIITKCETLIGLTLEELIELELRAMQGIADDLGL